MLKITKREFDLFTDFIIKRWGIDLDTSKVYLVESRLGDVVEKFHCKTYLELYQKAQSDMMVAGAVINAISTNETSFFRDEKIFDVIKGKIVPEALSKSKILNIWSAACSSGQEVYTLAILLKELYVSPTQYKIQITGTDISDRVLAYASHGIYTENEILRGLTPQRITSNFNKIDKGYQIKDELRFWTYFQRMNLTEPFPFYKKFDLVLCRNVSIYFNTETKKVLYDRIANVMSPKGLLFLGSSEMLFGITDRFVRLEHNNVPYYQLQS